MGISNFDNNKDGDIEIHYKGKEEILFDVEKALSDIGDYFDGYSKFKFDNIEELLSKKEELKSKLDNSNIKELDRESKRIARGLKELLELILDGLEENKNNLDRIVKENFLEKDILISESKSVFISNVIFYKNIELLKNIELIDTPGLGSNSQLDTRKSEGFISEADIVMILTDAKEPLQKDSETDILDILEDIQKKKDEKDFFNKVFIIVNKIDENIELTRSGIKDLLKKSLKKADIEINDKNIMFVSALYEYQKKFSKDGLKDLNLKNRDNIGDNDLEIIEKTIYNFSTAESTSKFLTENIMKIDEIFENLDQNFINNIKKLDGSIKETQKKIDKFEVDKVSIEAELKRELNKIIQDEYRGLLARSNDCKEENFNIIAKRDYAYDKAIKEKTFEKANRDTSSSNHYAEIGKKFLKEIIKKSNIKIEEDINKEVFSEKRKEEIQKKLKDKTSEIQKKYENEYGVVLELKDLEIDKIKIDLSDNIDLKRTSWREFKDIFWWPLGPKDKYADSTAEAWNKYSNDTYKPAITTEIKSKIDNSKDKVQKDVDIEISNIIETIEQQLNQELKDQQDYQINRDKTIHDKEKIQKAFKTLKTDFSDVAKEQNSKLFKIGE